MIENYDSIPYRAREEWLAQSLQQEYRELQGKKFTIIRDGVPLAEAQAKRQEMAKTALNEINPQRWMQLVNLIARSLPDGDRFKAQHKLAQAIWRAHDEIPYVARKDDVQAWRRMVWISMRCLMNFCKGV